MAQHARASIARRADERKAPIMCNIDFRYRQSMRR
jgi:hypothetical protein